MVTTRFAPAPTGRLHAGNIRIAVLNWLHARRHGGTFLLRLDDTDAARSTAANADAIRDDLAWLGLHPQAEHAQSARHARYDAALDRLVASGHAYPAYDTPGELALKRRLQRAAGKPPVYDRSALRLTPADRAALEAGGRRAHYRFRLDTTAPVRWHDLIRGETGLDPASLSDPIVRRDDGQWLYMLPSVIDDIDMRVTHVIRGEDHVPNSAIQLGMFAALGASPPAFAHASLLTGPEGALSKRLGSLGVGAFRDAGIEPAAVLAFLARLGSADPVEPIADPSALVATFDLARLGRAPARFDLEDLRALSAKTVHRLPHAAVASRLPPAIDEPAWNVLRANLATVADAADWSGVIAGTITPQPATPEDHHFLAAALDTVPPQEPWSPETWPEWTTALKARTGRKGRALYHPLRVALTARDTGPDMAHLLPLIGPTRTRTRLAAALAA